MKNEPMETQITEQAITRLVDGFYASVRQDSQLAPVFDRAIAEAEWPAHTMYRFWSSVMLTSGRYKGNPMAVHMGVAGIQRGRSGFWRVSTRVVGRL